MSDLVPAEDIERIVGCRRHPWAHYGRAVSAEQTVYILHSQECLDSGIDLRECEYSLALDKGIETRFWNTFEDRPVLLTISIISGQLLPGRAFTWIRKGLDVR